MSMRQVQDCARSIASIFVAAMTISGGTGVLAAEWCAGRVTDTQPRVVQPLSKPLALQSYIDPAFGTRVTRVTDAPAGSARRTLYTTIQPWNADESLLMLYHTGDSDAGHHLYDGQTYEYIRPMEFSAADIEGIYWDPIDANSLFFIQRRPRNQPSVGNLVRYDVRERTLTQIADLSGICGTPESRDGLLVTGGEDIQGIAGDLIGLRCQNNRINRNSSDISFTVNVRNGNIGDPVVLNPTLPQGDNTFGYTPELAVAPFPSGQRILVQNTVYDRSLNYLYRLDSVFGGYRTASGGTFPVPKAEHSTIGRMPNGNDALFTPQYEPTEFGCGSDSDFGRGALVAYDIQAEQCNVIVGRSTGWNYPLSGVHLSAVSTQNPGWVAMTSIGYGEFDYFSNERPAPLLFSELSLTLADPENPTTCRLAHTRSFGKSATRAASYNSSYFGEPHAVMSPSGSRILFNSDWYDSGTVDTYAVSLIDGPMAQTDLPVEELPDTSPPPPEPDMTESPTDTTTSPPEPEPVPVPVQDTPESSPTPTDTVAVVPVQNPLDVLPPDSMPEGYVFARTDRAELRWIDLNSEGIMGSTWISAACAASLGGATAQGDWRQLLVAAPATDTLDYPCLPSDDVRQSGYVYLRTDKSELRWIAANDAGEQGSVWISPSCALSLGGVTAEGNWQELMERAPALDTIASPCL